MNEIQKFVKIYYDAEFTGLHRDTTLISIGMVSESGSHFYAEFDDFDKDQVDDWLQEHVINNLMFNDKSFYLSPLNGRYLSSVDNAMHFDIEVKADSAEVKERLLSWLSNESKAAGNLKIQFYTDCYAYDWVLLNHLICDEGKALNLPEFLYYIPMDLSTVLQMRGVDPDINREEFIGENIVNLIKTSFPIKNANEDIKHNSLWDAYVCASSFKIIEK